MARNKKGRESNGNGSYRKKTIFKNGKKYECWEGRISLGYDDNGKPDCRSVSGKTKAEVQNKIKHLKRDYENQTLVPKNGMTLQGWLSVWSTEYLNHVASGTAHEYRQKAEKYINPVLGPIKLQQLTSLQIQSFVTNLCKSKK